MTETSADILVIGGGPAGAAVAALLAEAGVRTILCEQKVYPRPKVCGEFLSAHARPVLARLGLLETFDATAGPPIRHLLALPPEGPTLRAAMPPDAAGHAPRAMARDALDTMLLARAAENGAQVLQPCHVQSVTGSAASGFCAETSRGPIRAGTLILAHGLAQRGDLDPAHAPPSPRKAYMCFKTHLSGCDLPADTIAITGTRGLYAGLVQTSDGAAGQPRFSLAFVLRRERLDQLGPNPETHLAALRRDVPGFARLVRHAAPAGPWLASGPLSPGIRAIYRDGRFFVGNAAGEVHALVGEGVTLALRGAALLADALLAHPENPAAAGERYARAFRQEFAWRYHAANVFAGLVMRPPLAALAAGLLEARPDLLELCIGVSGKW